MKSFTTSAAGRKCLQYLVTVPIGRRGFASDPSPLLLKVINKPAAHSGHIRVISLNRPAARNALSVQLVDELTAQLRAIEAESRSRTISSAHADAQNDARSNTRVLIISSELDSCFCAGADLKERALFTPKE